MADQYIAVGGGSIGEAWGFGVLQWDGTNLTRIAARYPSQDSYGVSWSPVANDITTTATIAVALDAGSGEEGFYLERWEGGVYIGNKSTFLNEICYGCAFSPDGKYIAVTHENSPYFTLLQWDGTNLTVAATFTLPERGQGVAWSPDGQYIGVACLKYKHLFLLKWDEVNLTKVAEYALPCGTYGRVFDCAFSPNGQYIGVAFRSGAPDKAAGFFLLKWDEVNLTKVAEYDINPGTSERYCFTCRFSPNGQYIAVGHASNSSFTLLKWDGENLTLATQYPFVNDEWIYGVCFNETGTLIGVTTDEIPYFYLFSWDGTNLVLVGNYNWGKWTGSCAFPLPPVEGIGPPDNLLCEQTKNPTNVEDPKPEFSAIYRST